MSKVTVKGQSVEEAVRRALEQLGATEDQVEIQVLQQPSRGFLGFGAKPALVEVTLRQDGELEGRQTAQDKAVQFLKEVLPQMGVAQVEIEAELREGQVWLKISGERLGIVIGRRGQTLDALQYLTNVVANRRREQYVRFVLDAENYRERRKQALEQLADRLAKKVIRTREKIVLEPMSAAERKIIHTKLQNYAGVMTKSEGEEPSRRVVLLPK
ncbi:spoIIIJ-associated protein [Caldalkalibacillus uzonensis]|uniref:RNA-binding protein KhpB n=1 Tax=Caldalkalibacillus uzonensis TaxID=353224 RepID=A0ABU0CS88_9BACI|nr:RNA-binding cell elongation regulator Jag/EloR [Caldalkalibacillus uzonensis]MDQ0339280.1 spoIIIJ-associated protein [Caldalkalibacillus uzonensis]